MKTTCQKCEGTGIVYIPNGEDDFDTEYCGCIAGQKKEMEYEKELIEYQKMKMGDMYEDSLIGAEYLTQI